MKKKLLTLLSAVALAVPTLWAADQPSAVYIYADDPGTAMNSGFVPNPETDAQLSYDSASGCWVGQIENWTKYSSGRWCIKYFYSIEDNTVTVYATTGTNLNNTGLNFSSTDVIEKDITATPYTLNSEGSTGKLSYYGFGISMQSTLAAVDALVSLNLNDSKVTFTKMESAYQVPEFVSVTPESGSILTPSDDGSASVTVKFSGKINSLEALVEGEDVTPQPNADGTEWTIVVPKANVDAALAESNGSLNIKIQNALAEYNIPVTLAPGVNNFLNFTYGVKGVSKTATIKLNGSEDALAALTILESKAASAEDVQYVIGQDDVTFDGDSYEFPYSTFARFLFTVPENYTLSITSETDSADGANWVLGTAWSEKKVVDDTDENNPQISYQKVLEGTTLTVYGGSNGAVFNVNVEAVPVYISGAFNNNNPDGDAEWKLNQDEDNPAQYNKYGLEIAEGQFDFNFVMGKKYIVPAENVEVEFTDNLYTGSFILSDSASASWSYSDWAGGEVNMVVDLNEMAVTFQKEETQETLWYVSGKFNDNYPFDSLDWALTPVEDENGVYTGEFEAAEGEFAFNILNNEGLVLIPATIENVEVTFTDGEYSGNFDQAYDEEEMAYQWTYSAWKGGKFTVTLDINEGSIVIKADVADDDDDTPVYISGTFNNNNPDGDDEWKLNQDEDNAAQYNKYYFQIEEGQFDFNFVMGDKYIVPAENGEVEFTDNEYTGGFILSDSSSATWSCSDWAGGEVNIVVDFDTNTVIFQKEETQETMWFINGELNENYPFEGLDWLLTAVEGENGVYTGEFVAGEGEFAFNIVNNEGMVLIPASLETVEVEFTEGVYNGNFDQAYDEEDATYEWTYPTWPGGKFSVTLDLNEGAIVINALGTVSVESILKDNAIETIFNLQGVRVSKDNLSKGIYIINGKKVVVK